MMSDKVLDRAERCGLSRDKARELIQAGRKAREDARPTTPKGEKIIGGHCAAVSSKLGPKYKLDLDHGIVARFGPHCWNVINDDCIFDATADQFYERLGPGDEYAWPEDSTWFVPRDSEYWDWYCGVREETGGCGFGVDRDEVHQD